MDADDRFDRLLSEALAEPFSGWDFSYIQRWIEVEDEAWDYRALVDGLAATASSLLDLGTGGGEFLLGVSSRPDLTVATEGWMPNLPVAAANLRPAIHVVGYAGAPDNAQQTDELVEGHLPFAEETFDLVIDRHEAFRAKEVRRILRPGGTFITQQIGTENEREMVVPYTAPTLGAYVAQLEHAGLDVVRSDESFTEKRYLDIRAVVYNTKAIPDQFGSLDREALRAIYERVRSDGAFTVHHHRYLLIAGSRSGSRASARSRRARRS